MIFPRSCFNSANVEAVKASITVLKVRGFDAANGKIMGEGSTFKEIEIYE